MSRFMIGRRGRILPVTLAAIVLLAASCASAGQQAPAAADPDAPDSRAAVHARSSRDQTNRFAREEVLGAECSPAWTGDPPMQVPNCYGLLPGHVAEFLRSIPDSHPYLDADYRLRQATRKQQFLFVDGYGERPDVLARITDRPSMFWIRSFEGPDPDVTVYVVYGPGCSDDPGFRARSTEDDCLAGHPYVTRELRIYRVRSGGSPEDVTSTLAPPPPALTGAERKRYGIYLRPPEEGEAQDTDVGLDIRGLARTPVMRWVIDPAEEGGYEKPRIPDSDPRGFHHQAHFGFLVWNGRRFELRDRIPASLWVCGVRGAEDSSCVTSGDGHGDPYLVEGPGSERAERRPE